MTREVEEWIFLKYDVQPNLFICERCGDTFPIQTPCSGKMMIAVGDAFNKQHKRCKHKPGAAMVQESPLREGKTGSCTIVITPRSAAGGT